MLKQKFYGVDFLRVVACLSVCLFHFCNLKVDDSFGYLSKDNWLLKVSNFIWYFMFCFFIISSYVLFFSLKNENYSYNNFKTFILRRFWRIYPPFLISVLVFILIQYLFTLNPSYNGSAYKIDPNKLISNLLFCPSLFGQEWYNPIYWTLAIEFQFYIVLGLIFPLLNSEIFKKSYFYEAIAIVITYFTIYLDLTWLNFNKQTILSYWDLFYIGFILYRYKSDTIGSPKFIILALLTLPGIFIHYFLTENFTIFFVSIISSGIIIFMNKQHKVILKISDISYSFYLTHGFTGGLFIYFTRNIFLGDNLRTGIVISACIFSLIGSLPYYWIIEKPFQKISKKLSLNSFNYSPKQ